jgi:hypothetical protein
MGFSPSRFGVDGLKPILRLVRVYFFALPYCMHAAHHDTRPKRQRGGNLFPRWPYQQTLPVRQLTLPSDTHRIHLLK